MVLLGDGVDQKGHGDPLECGRGELSMPISVAELGMVTQPLALTSSVHPVASVHVRAAGAGGGDAVAVEGAAHESQQSFPTGPEHAEALPPTIWKTSAQEEKVAP